MKTSLDAELAAFVSSLARNYPHGIPLALIEEARRRPVSGDARGGRRPVAFLVSPIPSPGTPERALLEAAITKGMHLSLSDVALVAAPADVPPGALCVEVGSSRPELGLWREEDSTSFMPTHSLTDVLASPAVKRSFWEHLKQVLARSEKV